MSYDVKTDVLLSLYFSSVTNVLLPFRWVYIVVICWDKSSTAYLKCDQFILHNNGYFTYISHIDSHWHFQCTSLGLVLSIRLLPQRTTLSDTDIHKDMPLYHYVFFCLPSTCRYTLERVLRKLRCAILQRFVCKL